ncbi:MAG: TraB/GumN family protein [Gammaproteobacteria bacterium]|nr:TraB/GumN family protein [Gammaproteobacteria bacterium]
MFGFGSRSRTASILVVPLLFFLGASPAGASEGPLWKVTGANGTAYLMGSIHFGTQAMYPLSASVNAAFESADRLVVEIDLQAMDPAAMARWISTEGAYRDGTTLADHVSPEVWTTLQRRAEEFSVPVELLAIQRPWLAAFTLTAMALGRRGYREDLGIDRHFLASANGRIPVIELEGFDYQMRLLTSLSADEQEQFLEATLRDLDAGSETFENIISAWKRGDAGALDVEINAAWRADPGGRVLYTRLIEQRNAAMAMKIASLLESGSTSFVVVGAAHLVGEGGLARRLEARGYRVEKR